MAENEAKDKQADYCLAAQNLYDADAERLNSTYNTFAKSRDNALSNYSDAVNAYNDIVNYAAKDYADSRSNDYRAYQDNREFLQQQYWNDVQQANKEKELAQKQTEYNRSLKEMKRQASAEKKEKYLGADLFEASVRTKREFARKGNSDKASYNNYQSYIAAKILEWFDAGKLTEQDAAVLADKYGIPD